MDQIIPVRINDTHMLKVSIITVSYNSKSTIADTILSVISQTYTNIEHIIIDGASTDGTKEIINSFRSKISMVVMEPDKGIYDAMNKGITLASGDIIGILNSDDFLASNDTIEKIAIAFEQEGCDAIIGNVDFVASKNNNKVIRRWINSPYKKGSFAKGWHPSHPAFYVKQEIYKKYGNFDITLNVSADFELMLRFIEKYQIKVHYLNLTIVRMRYGGTSTGSLKRIFEGNKNIIKAFRMNDISISPFYPIMRIVSKLRQFIIK